MRNFTGRERERDINLVKFTEERERGAARDINFDEHIIYRERERERDRDFNLDENIQRQREGYQF